MGREEREWNRMEGDEEEIRHEGLERKERKWSGTKGIFRFLAKLYY